MAQNCPSLKFRVKAKGAVYKSSTIIIISCIKVRLGQMFQTEINASDYNTKAQNYHSLIITAKAKGVVYKSSTLICDILHQG